MPGQREMYRALQAIMRKKKAAHWLLCLIPNMVLRRGDRRERPPPNQVHECGTQSLMVRGSRRTSPSSRIASSIGSQSEPVSSQLNQLDSPGEGHEWSGDFGKGWTELTVSFLRWLGAPASIIKQVLAWCGWGARLRRFMHQLQMCRGWGLLLFFGRV
jgi:hypothetical protein